MNVNGIQPSITSLVNDLKPTASSTKISSPTEQVGKTFQDLLGSLDQSQNTSDQLIQQMAAGENVDISDVMIANQETDINFRVAMAIRDRLVDAYKEVMRMSV